MNKYDIELEELKIEWDAESKKYAAQAQQINTRKSNGSIGVTECANEVPSVISIAPSVNTEETTNVEKSKYRRCNKNDNGNE